MTDKQDRAPRRCLRCRGMFPSQHAGNRICLECAAAPEYRELSGGIPELVGLKQGGRA
jgi:hypothetical protein